LLALLGFTVLAQIQVRYIKVVLRAQLTSITYDSIPVQLSTTAVAFFRNQSLTRIDGLIVSGLMLFQVQSWCDIEQIRTNNREETPHLYDVSYIFHLGCIF